MASHWTPETLETSISPSPFDGHESPYPIPHVRHLPLSKCLGETGCLFNLFWGGGELIVSKVSGRFWLAASFLELALQNW